MTAVNKYTEAQIEEIIKEHIVQNFMYDRPDGIFSNDLPLLEEGIIDSLGILKLASFLEEKFGVTLNPEELLLENLGTVNAIKSFIISRL
jgi:Acyl carrier protein